MGVVAAKRPIYFEIGPIVLEVDDLWWSHNLNKICFVMDGDRATELGTLILAALGEPDEYERDVNLGRVKVTIQSVEEGEP